MLGFLSDGKPVLIPSLPLVRLIAIEGMEGYICTGPCNPVRKTFIFRIFSVLILKKIPDIIPGSIRAPMVSATGKRSQIYAPIFKVLKSGVFYQTDDFIVPPKMR